MNPQAFLRGPVVLPTRKLLSVSRLALCLDGCKTRTLSINPTAPSLFSLPFGRDTSLSTLTWYQSLSLPGAPFQEPDCTFSLALVSFEERGSNPLV